MIGIGALSVVYTPLDWYWQAADGRIYSSKRNALVYYYDSGYLAFIATNGRCTPWPVDTNGVQSTAALQAVVGQYNIILPFS